jgi:hypothetical protein
VIVVVPTVSLVRQQCVAFEQAGFRPASGGGPTTTAAAAAAAPTADLPAVDWCKEGQGRAGLGWVELMTCSLCAIDVGPGPRVLCNVV